MQSVQSSKVTLLKGRKYKFTWTLTGCFVSVTRRAQNWVSVPGSAALLTGLVASAPWPPSPCPSQSQPPLGAVMGRRCPPEDGGRAMSLQHSQLQPPSSTRSRQVRDDISPWGEPKFYVCCGDIIIYLSLLYFVLIWVKHWYEMLKVRMFQLVFCVDNHLSLPCK